MILIIAEGNHGKTVAKYHLDAEGILRLIEDGDYLGLAGNRLAGSFDGQKLAEIDFEKITAEWQHHDPLCGCHLCGFRLYYEKAPLVEVGL